MRSRDGVPAAPAASYGPVMVTLRTNGCAPARPPVLPATRGFGNGSRTCSTRAEGCLWKVTPTSRGPAATGRRKSMVDACA